MKPGVYHGLSYADYDAIPALRSSTLTSFRSATPAHWKAKQAEADKECFAKGRELHIAVLEPDRFDERVKTRLVKPTAEELGFYSSTGKPGFYTDEQRAERDRIYAEIDAANATGEYVLDSDQIAVVERMAASVSACACDVMGISFMDTELTVVWVDEETGLLCKARIDIWDRAERRIYELKQTRVIATPENFSREIRKNHYAHQLAWYARAAEAQLGGIAHEEGAWMIVVENFEPHLVAVRPVNQLTMMTAKIDMEDALRSYASCVKHNDWPGHEGGDSWYLPGHSDDETLGIHVDRGDAL